MIYDVQVTCCDSTSQLPDEVVNLQVEAETLSEAFDLALSDAITEHPNHDGYSMEIQP